MTQSSLYDKILKASNYISNMSRKGASNYIITSHQVSQVISDIEKAVKDLISKQARIWRILKISKIWNKKLII
jgi:hypothetical protein